MTERKAIQAHHENMVFAVEIGEIRITDETGEEIVGVTGTGFAQIINNRAMVIVDTCESPEEIDVRRAEEAKERAQEQLRQKQSIQEYYRSKASLARAMSRLPRSGKRPSDRILRRKMVLRKVPAGLREKNVSQTRRDLVIMRVGRKGAVRGSGNEKPARETRKETDFGSGREKSVARPGGSQNAAM